MVSDYHMEQYSFRLYCGVYQNFLEGLLKHRLLGLTPSRSGWGLRIWTSNGFPDEADDVALGTHSEDYATWLSCSPLNTSEERLQEDNKLYATSVL